MFPNDLLQRYEAYLGKTNRSAKNIHRFFEEAHKVGEALKDCRAFWVLVFDVVKEKGLVIPALIRCLERSGSGLQLTDQARQSLQPSVNEKMKSFLLNERGLIANWSLDLPAIPHMPIEGSSYQLALFYAARAALLGEPIHHDIIFTGAVNPEGGLIPANHLKEKMAAAQDLGLRVVAPVPAQGALSLETLEKVDSFYPRYFGQGLLDDKRLRSRPQREYDLRAVEELNSLCGSLTSPLVGATPQPDAGLVWSWLGPWLRDTRVSAGEEIAVSVDEELQSFCHYLGGARSKALSLLIKGCDRDSLAPRLIALGGYFALRTAKPKNDVAWQRRSSAADSILVGTGLHPDKGPSGNALVVQGSLDAKAGFGQEIHRTLDKEETRAARLIDEQQKILAALDNKEDFRLPDMSDRLKYFTGRGWLIEKVYDWLKEESHAQKARALFLGAKPGWGKTSFMAHLVEKEPGASAAYYCQDEEKTAERFIKAFANRLSPYCSEIATVGPLTEEGRRDQGAYQKDLWIHHITNPLRNRHTPVVLYLDALDTAKDISALLDRVNASNHMPDCLRIVAMGRYDCAPTTLVGLSPAFIPLPLEGPDDGARNLEDLQDYVEKRLRRLSSEPEGKASDDQLSRRINKFTEKAKGLFIYAKYAIDGLEKGRWTEDTLPKDMPGIYHDWFMGYPNFRNDYEPILGLISAARPPFSEELLLAWLADKGLTDFELEEKLDELGPFLRTDAGALSYYHSTLEEWLTDKSNKAFRVDLKRAHLRIIAACPKEGDWPELFRKFRDETARDASEQ